MPNSKHKFRRRRLDTTCWCLFACALAVFTGTRAGPKDARVSENLHGDNHPAVSISFDNAGLVYQYDEDGSAKSMEVHVWINGCVAGFDYLVHVEEHNCPAASNCYASQFWSQQITMLDERPFFPSLDYGRHQARPANAYPSVLRCWFRAQSRGPVCTRHTRCSPAKAPKE